MSLFLFFRRERVHGGKQKKIALVCDALSHIVADDVRSQSLIVLQQMRPATGSRPWALAAWLGATVVFSL